jgi:hypothetical protein
MALLGFGPEWYNPFELVLSPRHVMAVKRAEQPGSHSRALNKAIERSWRFYNSTLKNVLEPDYNGQFVAIHDPSNDYVVAPTSGDAMRAMHERHPEGTVLLHRIGPSLAESGLATRMLGAQTVARFQ